MTQFHVDEAVMKSLSKNELSVLQYIYAHPQKVCSMSIKELSSQVCYSPTTVLRLCKKLNLSGFAELKYTLKSRLNHPAPTFSASKGESRDDTEILENISKELAATFHFIDHEQLLEIVTLLDSHKPLYIYSPSGITELPTDKAGAFDDFMMGNGNAVIFYPEGADGYELKKGDTVTLSFKTEEPISIEFGYILDSSAHELATLADKNFSAGMEIPEDGTYCFYIINASSEVNEFTDGNITIN